MERRLAVYKKVGPIALIELNRPRLQNAINMKMVSDLVDIQEEIHQDPVIRAVIMTGRGQKAFSAGTDRDEYHSSDPQVFLRRASAASVFQNYKPPTLAAINGDALGQGLELALACDLRICAGHARFAMPAIRDGEIPWDGGTQRLSRLVGKAKALEMIFTGESIGAREAYRIGLVNQMVPARRLLPAALDMARNMAQKAPWALKYAKEAVHHGLDLTLQQGLQLEADLYYLIHTTRDRTEGIKSFREKRRPQFQGE